jgi:hypothetical protein
MLTSAAQVPEITIGVPSRAAIPPAIIARKSLLIAVKKTPGTVKKTPGTVRRTLDMVGRVLATVGRVLATVGRVLATVGRVLVNVRKAATTVRKVDTVVDVAMTRRASVTTGCLEALETKRSLQATVDAGRSTVPVADTTTEGTAMTEGTRPALSVLGYRVP